MTTLFCPAHVKTKIHIPYKLHTTCCGVKKNTQLQFEFFSYFYPSTKFIWLSVSFMTTGRILHYKRRPKTDVIKSLPQIHQEDVPVCPSHQPKQGTEKGNLFQHLPPVYRVSSSNSFDCWWSTQ